MNPQFDAIVVGAGPAGSTLCVLLARAGWNVALVERARFPRRKVCGECIAASNIPLLEALGVGRRFAHAAGPELRKVGLMRGRRLVLAELPAARADQAAWGRALGRETLDGLLLEQARTAGASVMQPWAVTAIEGRAGAMHCTLAAMDYREERRLGARLVVAAHGSWELLPSERRTAGRAKRPGDLLAFKANFRGAALEAGLLPVLSLRAGYGGMVIGDNEILTLACCLRRDRLEELRRDAPGECAGDVVERTLRRECSGVARVLDGAQRDGAWLASGPLAPGIRLRAGEAILRVGNAAGEAHPIIGEGISMALQSAWLLAAHLLEPHGSRMADARALDERKFAQLQADYAANWRRHFARRLRIAAAFAHLAMQPRLANALLGAFALWPRALTYAARLSGKVDYLRLRHHSTAMPTAMATATTRISASRTSRDTDSIAAPKK